MSQSATLWQLMKLPWYWRGKHSHSFLRTSPLILVAILQISAFGAAGLFSSRVSSQSDEVLIRYNDYCGVLNPPATAGLTLDYLEAESSILVETRNLARRSYEYAQNCYIATPSNSTCTSYAKPRILSNVNDTFCPFHSPVCRVGDTAFVSDTGPLDSDNDLGINAPEQDRVTYRKVMTCAVLNTTQTAGYRSGWTIPRLSSLPGDEYLRYLYGPSASTNWTWQYGNYSGYEAQNAYQLECENLPQSHIYKNSFIVINSVQSALHGMPVETNNFEPIAALNTTDADLSLIFLTNNAFYPKPVRDSWFSSTTSFFNTDLNMTMYSRDYLGVSVMGCQEQYQFCNPAVDICTPLGGQKTIGNFLWRNLKYNDRQGATQQMLWIISQSNNLADFLIARGESALNANDLVVSDESFISVPLPDNQWKLEVVNWHNALTANLQQNIISYALGPTILANQAFVSLPKQPNAVEAKEVCRRIKMRNPGYVSFSVIGVALILCVGIFIVLTNLVIVPLISFIQHKLDQNNYARKEWIHSEILQLLRTTFEGVRLGTWEGREALVPVTAEGEKFGLPVYGNEQSNGFGTILGTPSAYEESHDGHLSPFLKHGFYGGVHGLQ